MNTNNWLNTCLEQIKQARVAVVGDFCLDAYWFIDTNDSELSVETGLPVWRVKSQCYSPGAAGNVTANLAALGVGTVSAIGVMGRDLFGDELLRQLNTLGIEIQAVCQDQPDWQTNVYSKPCIGDAEQNRIDFGGFNVPSAATIDAVVGSIEEAAQTHDTLIVNQQIPTGLCTHPTLIDAVNRVAAGRPELLVIVDSRHNAGSFHGVSIKINETEANRLVDGETTPTRTLYERMQRPIFVTRGEHGIVVAHAGGIDEIPGIPVRPPIDTVGAGDTVLAAIAAVMAGDHTPEAPVTSAKFANIAAAVVIKKLHVTGTASPDEIASQWSKL